MNKIKHINYYCIAFLLLSFMLLSQTSCSGNVAEDDEAFVPTGRPTVTTWPGEQKEDFIFAEEELAKLQPCVSISIHFFKADPPESDVFIEHQRIFINDDEAIKSIITSLKKIKGVRATLSDRKGFRAKTVELRFSDGKGTELLFLGLTAVEDVTDAVWQFQNDPLYPPEEIYLLNGEWGSFQKWEKTLNALKKK